MNIRHLLSKKLFSEAVCLASIVAVFIFIILPLLHDGFFPTFDDVQVVRIEVMLKELKSGRRRIPRPDAEE